MTFLPWERLSFLENWESQCQSAVMISQSSFRFLLQVNLELSLHPYLSPSLLQYTVFSSALSVRTKTRTNFIHSHFTLHPTWQKLLVFSSLSWIVISPVHKHEFNEKPHHHRTLTFPRIIHPPVLQRILEPRPPWSRSYKRRMGKLLTSKTSENRRKLIYSNDRFDLNLQFNAFLNTVFSSPVTVALIVAVFLDNTLEVEKSKKDRGMPWWVKFRTFRGDNRNEEFYTLPFNLNRFFPPT